MKKFLLLAVSVVCSLAAAAQGVTAPPSGTQVVNADFNNGGNPFTNGTVIALQCLDTNGGVGWYLNGAQAKSETFSSANLYRVVTTDNGRFKLQNYTNEAEYIGRASNADHALVVMKNSDQAETFTAAIASPTGWTTKPSTVVGGTNTVRFTASDNRSFLNTNDKLSTPKYWTGTGGYSAWYVYKFTDAEAEHIVEIEKVYRMGQVVESLDDLTSGTYFIRAHANGANGDMARGEGMVYDYNSDSFAAGLGSNYELVGATDNLAYVWKLEVTDTDLPAGATPGGKVFTIRNLQTNTYWSVSGGQGTDAAHPAKGSFYKNTYTAKFPNNPECQAPGQYQLVEVVMPEEHPEYYGNKTDAKRFFLQLTNAQFQNGSTIAYPFVHTNPATPVTLSYWANYDVRGTAVQFDLVKAEEVKAVSVTVNFPPLNGIAIASQTVNIDEGATAEEVVESLVDNMNKGGFTIANITSSTGGNTITEDGQVLTVEGKWEREVVPGQVYRIRIRTDNDSYGAIRYMISTGDIETRRENMETLTRLVPERLWYFTVDGEGHYILHTLHDTDKAVKFSQLNGSWNHATASLETEGTPLFFAALSDGDFTLRLIVDGSNNAWLNDFGGVSGAGKLSVYTYGDANSINDSGSFMRVYPLTEEDFNALSGFASAEEIAEAKANPTLENVKPIIDAYNADNVEAALKRVEYIFSSGTIGPNPGQYSDATGEFAAAVEHLRQTASNEAATHEELQEAIAAVNALIKGSTASQFTFNEMTSGFYRFRTKLASGRYLSSLYGGVAAQKDAMAMTDDATRSNTVYYVEAKDTNDDPASVNYTVICFDNGLVLPNLNGTSWMPALDGTTNASENVNFNYKNDGTYVIHVGLNGNGGHRHLHGGTGAGEVANAGGGDDDGYRWYIERVTELPVTFYNVMGQDGFTDDGWTSVYSPVALELPAEFTHTTAYTGELDDTDYTGKPDINYVLATPIEPDEDGRVIIPANQPTLLFYDGELSPSENPNLDESLMENRSHITYLHLPIVAGYESAGEMKGNLKGGFLATLKAENTDYLTLHASHSNNFREYGEYDNNYDYVPGFKAFIETAHGEDAAVYPIYTVNPNAMVSVVGEDSFVVEKQDNGLVKITVNTPAADYEVYYKHTAAAVKQNTVRRAADHTGYNLAEKVDDVHHTFMVEPGNVDYYAYHRESDTQGVTRSISVSSDGTTTGINEIAGAEDAAIVYDLQGRRLSAPVKGFNIVNGKKILVK